MKKIEVKVRYLFEGTYTLKSKKYRCNEINNGFFCHFAIFSYLCGRKKTLLFRLKIG